MSDESSRQLLPRRRAWKWLWRCLVVGFVLCGGFAWVIGGRLVEPANRVVGPFPAGVLPAGTRVTSTKIASPSGSNLAVWYVPYEDAKATILLLHPIRGDRRSMLGRAKLFFEAGYSLVLIDLQAHGESPGDAITVGYRERLDVIAAVEFIRKQNPGHRVGVVGRSLGGAAALLASPLVVDALVLESVYPTITEAVHNRVSMRLGPASHIVTPALVAQLRPRLGFSPSQLRPIEKIGEVGCPVLVASGDLDTHTTLGETRRMFRAAREPKWLAIFEGAAHEDLLEFDREQYRDEVLTFLNGCLN